MKSTDIDTDTGTGRDDGGAGGPEGRLLLAAVRLVGRALHAAREEDGPGAPATALAPALHGDKVRCEAAMLLRAVAPLADRVPGLPDSAAGLAAELTAHTPDDLAVRLCLHPGLALDLALVPLHLRDLGLGDPRLEPLLADLFGADRLRGPERPPHRDLEQQWLHGLWSPVHRTAGLAAAVAASCLAWEFDHLSGTTEDAYAFTHAILYASDLGRRRVALPRPVAEIERDAEAILAVALDAGNHDVAAEALWTWPMLGLSWTPLAARARTLLAAVSDAHGFLPGPGFDPGVADRLSPPERQSYVLRTSYHTTLVHGLLLATCLRGGPREPDSSAAAATRSRPGATTALAALCPPGPGAREWWGLLAALPAGERDTLAPAVATMALRRAATNADLAALRNTLELAAAYHLDDSPAIRQGRLLLRRAVACVPAALGYRDAAQATSSGSARLASTRSAPRAGWSGDGTATTVMPAARAAVTPVVESSNARQAAGSAPSSSHAAR